MMTLQATSDPLMTTSSISAFVIVLNERPKVAEITQCAFKFKFSKKAGVNLQALVSWCLWFSWSPQMS